MTIKVRIPTPLQKLTKDQAEVSVQGKTIAEVIEKLKEKQNCESAASNSHL